MTPDVTIASQEHNVPNEAVRALSMFISAVRGQDTSLLRMLIHEDARMESQLAVGMTLSKDKYIQTISQLPRFTLELLHDLSFTGVHVLQENEGIVSCEGILGVHPSRNELLNPRLHCIYLELHAGVWQVTETRYGGTQTNTE